MKKWYAGQEVAIAKSGIADHQHPFVVVGPILKMIALVTRDKFTNNPDEISREDLMLVSSEDIVEWIPPITTDAEGRKVVVTKDRELHLASVISDNRASGGGVVGAFRSSDFADGSWNQKRKKA